MSQEYTEDKEITLPPLNNRQRLREALSIMVTLFTVFLMIALLSFHPSDPSWSQTAWQEPIHNWGGKAGAWLADTLLFIFGVIAYVVPVMILFQCWKSFRPRYRSNDIDYFTIALSLIGTVALITTTCGLAAMNADDIWYFSSGGVIGSLVRNGITVWFSLVEGTFILLCLWAAGFTLYTGWSWLTIAEKIGALVMHLLALVSTHFFTQVQRRDQQDASVSEKPTVYDDDDLLLAELKPLHDGQITQDSGKDSLQAEAHADGELPETASPAYTLKAIESAEVSDNTSQVEIPQVYRFDVPDKMFADTNHENNNKNNELNKEYEKEKCSSASPPFFASAEHSLSDGVMADLQSFTDGINAGALALDRTADNSSKISSQVKKGIGPELPRPNPVKLPTRRELASYGIKLPSQRKVEEEKSRHSSLPSLQAYRDDKKEVKTEPAIPAQTLRQQDVVLTQQDDVQSERYSEPRHDKREHHREEMLTTIDERGFCSVNQPENNTPPDGGAKPDKTITLEAAACYPTERQPTTSLQLGSQEEPLQPNDSDPASMMAESLFHPFLVRDDQPVQKTSTPLPTLELLTPPPEEEQPIDMFLLEQTARLVEARLADYRVKADVVDIFPGPVITRYELNLAPGVKAARITSLSRDLARSLSTVAVRVVEVIPGKPYVGLELPNKYRQTVYLREVLDCAQFRDNPSPLAVVLGKDIAGQPVVADLGKMPHLLVAGTTGSGKSVGVNAMVISMLYKATPEDVRFIMIDPKMLELSVYEGIPHLLTEVVTDMKDAANALRWSVGEMERRYKLMSALGVRNLAGYNEKIEQAAAMERPIPDPFWKASDSMDDMPPVLEKLPYIVVMVDEFADLMMTVGKKVEELIARLAQKARAAGIHLVLATQRPSVDVITGLIKANIPTRIAFTVSSKIDSRTILDQMGAESLLGMGDMLYLAPNSSMPIRVHGAFVRDEEVHAVVQDWKARGRPNYIDNITESDQGDVGGSGFDGDNALDPLFDQAVAFVIEKRRASISGVQRQFRIGYNRAARIIEQMEAQSIVSPPSHNGNREVLAPPAN